jgi:glutathione S-transferase
MTDVVIHGLAPSTYTRTARLACEEKGVSHRLEPVEFGSARHLALHPFGKIPILEHGSIRLFETLAITRYIDEAFKGPALQPADPKARAVMTQWISAVLDYVYPVVVRGLILPRLVFPSRGVPVDEAAVKANLPKVEDMLSKLDGALDSSRYFAGDSLSLADLFVLPILPYLGMIPDSQKMIPKFARLSRWQDSMLGRQSAPATEPKLAA